MSDVRVARRYAKSLVQIAQEQGQLEQIHDDMLLVRDSIEASRELELALSSPLLNTGKKQAIVSGVFGDKVGEITNSFFRILVSKGREGVLLEISRQVHFLYNSIKGIQIAEVQTPFPLTEALRKKFTDIIKEVSGKPSVELKETVSEDLIGGYILRIDDRQLDDSVRTRLNELKYEMVG